METTLKKTPLHAVHVQAGARIAEYEGWALPVQFEGMLKEHERVRLAAGVFDVSHMGQILVDGSGSIPFLEKMLTNRIEDMQNGTVRYTLMCDERGGVMDDLLVYRFGANRFRLVVNASRLTPDLEWLHDHAGKEVDLDDETFSFARLALQGPLSCRILQKLVNRPLNRLGSFQMLFDERANCDWSILSRTGYTGEDGFEIFIRSDKAPRFYGRLLMEGVSDGLMPTGLAARDSLRTEAGLPLYGHEISLDVTPLEAGLERFVDFSKADFMGKEPLCIQLKHRISRVLTGIVLQGKGVLRSGLELFIGDEQVGIVSSGNYSPCLKRSIGMAFVKTACSSPGTVLDVFIRQQQHKGEIVSLPFIKRKKMQGVAQDGKE